MNNSTLTSYKKAVQALNLLATRKGGSINKMKAIKLIYFADRLHIRKYGRPIVGDAYFAMKLGPVGSRIKRSADLEEGLPEAIFKYAKEYIVPSEDKQTVISVKAPDRDVFSKTDLECLKKVYEAFADKDQFELAKLTHSYPEWTKHERVLKLGKKRVPMEYEDFFSRAGRQDGIFDQDPHILALSKDQFEESQEVEHILA